MSERTPEQSLELMAISQLKQREAALRAALREIAYGEIQLGATYRDLARKALASEAPPPPLQEEDNTNGK